MCIRDRCRARTNFSSEQLGYNKDTFTKGILQPPLYLKHLATVIVEINSSTTEPLQTNSLQFTFYNSCEVYKRTNIQHLANKQTIAVEILLYWPTLYTRCV